MQPSPARESARPSSAAERRARREVGTFTERERRQARRLFIVLLVVAVFSVVEFAGAVLAGSDVLQADAIHLTMDVAALGTALMAMRVAVRRPTLRFTFGLRRAEPVAAVINAMLVLIATALIVREGIADLAGHEVPRPDVMLVVAILALVVNGVSAWLIHGAIEQAHELGEHATEHAHHAHHEHHEHHAHHEHDEPHAHEGHDAHAHARKHGHALNLRGALLHLMGDALGALAALVAAVLIRMGFSSKVDPIASFVVAAILFVGALRLLRDGLTVLLEAAPEHLPVDRVRAVVAGTAGVAELHDLHVWSLGAGHDAITAHVRSTGADATVGARVERAIRSAFHVEYVTVQVEVGDQDCDAP